MLALGSSDQFLLLARGHLNAGLLEEAGFRRAAWRVVGSEGDSKHHQAENVEDQEAQQVEEEVVVPWLAPARS